MTKYQLIGDKVVSVFKLRGKRPRSHSTVVSTIRVYWRQAERMAVNGAIENNMSRKLAPPCRCVLALGASRCAWRRRRGRLPDVFLVQSLNLGRILTLEVPHEHGDMPKGCATVRPRSVIDIVRQSSIGVGPSSSLCMYIGRVKLCYDDGV
jgi:hypothetical protein